MPKWTFAIALWLTASAAAAQNLEPADSVHGHAVEGAIHLNEVVVVGTTGKTLLKETPLAMSVVGHRALQEKTASNIIDALAKEPGVSQITTGGGISKPVVRGLGFNRVLVVQNGVRQEGQQWGDEHGVEIDPQSVYSAEILKGPGSLMYGSDALAGVLILNSAPVLPEGKQRAGGSLEYQTNAGLYGASGVYEGNLNNIFWNVRGSVRGAHDYKNRRDGRVFGSAFAEQGIEGMGGLRRAWGSTRLSLSYYHLRPNIVEGERDEQTGDLIGSDGLSYGKRLPFQHVSHFKAASESDFRLGDDHLKLLLAYQQNQRKEYEESLDEFGLFLKLHTLTYALNFLSAERAGWKFLAGVGGMYQQSKNLGEEFLVPSYNLFDIGTYASASKRWGRLNLSGGLRGDWRRVHSYALYDAGDLRFAPFSRHFSGLTGSVGVAYEPARELSLKANISRGFRAPNISELGANGEHEGTFRYEQGNADLKPEYSWQFDAGLYYSSRVFSVDFSVFANLIENYIFAEKAAAADGSEVLIDDVPVYRFVSGDARLWGGEVAIDWHPVRTLHVENALSYVCAVQLHRSADEKYLPLTPAPRWDVQVRYDLPLPAAWPIRGGFVGAGMELNFKQNHYYGANDTETATPAYALFDLSVGGDVHAGGRKVCSVLLACENLFNKAYQNHLSRLKYADWNAVTGRRGVFNQGRNIVLKIIF